MSRINVIPWLNDDTGMTVSLRHKENVVTMLSKDVWAMSQVQRYSSVSLMSQPIQTLLLCYKEDVVAFFFVNFLAYVETGDQSRHCTNVIL